MFDKNLKKRKIRKLKADLNSDKDETFCKSKLCDLEVGFDKVAPLENFVKDYGSPKRSSSNNSLIGLEEEIEIHNFEGNDLLTTSHYLKSNQIKAYDSSRFKN